MGRPTKTGFAPLNRVAVDWKAKSHAGVADELRKVVAAAIHAMPSQSISSAEPASVQELLDLLQQVMAFNSAILGQHVELLGNLESMSGRHQRLAQMCLAAAGTIKAGRPPKTTPPPRMGGMLGRADKLRSPGRPRHLYRGFDEDVYREVEALLATRATSNRPLTIKAAINSMLDDAAKANGVARLRLDDSNYGRFRAAYGRGKKLAKKA